jgi:predicted transcriptional regulator
MLIVETIARIRREHFIKGKTIKEIVRDLKVSRNTVRKVLRSGETSFEYERVVQPRPKLGRWAAELDGLLAGNAAKAAREQLTLIRIFEELRGVAMTAATTLCAVTPDGGARSADNRRRQPMSR